MTENSRDEEIQAVMEDEKRRGSRRRPVDTETLRKRRRTEADLRRIFRYGDERELSAYLRGIGIRDESPQFAQILRDFRNLRYGKKS